MQGKANRAPPYEKVLAHFLTETRSETRACAGEFSARVTLTRLSGVGIRWKRRTDFSGRRAETKTDEELKLIGRALQHHRKRGWHAEWKF
mgnify:CR=1 FL=1